MATRFGESLPADARPVKPRPDPPPPYFKPAATKLSITWRCSTA